MNQIRKSGVLLSPVKNTDRKVHSLIGVCGLSELPTQYENPLLRKSPTYDQGSTSMCVAYSLALTRWLVEYDQSGNKLDYSPGMIYGNRFSSDYQGEGMYIMNALSHLKNEGVCHMEDFSYSGTYEQCNAIYSSKKSKLASLAKPWRISSYYRCDTVNDMKKAIKELGFIEISVKAGYDFSNPDKNTHKIKTNTKINDSNGLHAIVVAGWDEYGWIIKNSWGKSYGDNGIAYLPYDYPIEEAFTYVDEVKEMTYKMLVDNFEDGHESEWAVPSVEKALKKGLIKGYKDEETGKLYLRPNEPLTRCQFCALMDRLGYLD